MKKDNEKFTMRIIDPVAEGLLTEKDVLENARLKREGELAYARDEGRAEGIAEGIAEGMEEVKISVIKNMLKAKTDISFISSMTETSEKEIEAIAKTL